MASNPVTAELKFLANLDEPLTYIPSKGGGDKTEHVGNYVLHEVEVHNARNSTAAFDLDKEGFRLVAQPTTVTDFFDSDQVESVYHGEVIDTLKRETGASRVEIFDDTLRASSVSRQKRHGIRDPANIVHNDYTARSGVKRLYELFPDEAEKLQQRRFAIVNVWRSIGGTVQNHPLVLCDATSVGTDELVAVERRTEERTGELQVAMHNAQHRWFYYPHMRMDEALIFKTFDSETDGRTRFTIHSSFKDPTAPADAPPRQSIETRCFVFF